MDDGLRRLLDAGGLGSWEWNRDRDELEWSESLETLFGFEPGTFPGTFAAYVDRVHPEDRAALLAAIDEAVEHGAPHQIVHRVVWPDGSIHWIEGRGHAEAHGMSGVAWDVTDRQVALEAVHRSEALNRAVLDAAADAIITIDEHGTILSANQAAERVFGYQTLDMVGRNVSMLMPEPYRSEHDGYVRRYLETGEARIIGIGRQVEGLRSDGSVFPIDLAVSEALVAGRPLFTGIARDMTDFVQLLEATEAARAAAEEARQGLEALQEITDAALAKLSLESLFRELLDRIRDVLDVDAARILLVESDGTTLSTGGVSGFDAGFEDEADLELDTARIPRVVARQPGSNSARSGVRRHGITSLASVPLLSGSRVVGIVEVGTRESRQFGARDLALLELAGERIAVAIERNRQYKRERDARALSDFLGRVTDILARSLDRAEICREVTRAGVPRLGDWCSLHVMTDDERAPPLVECAHIDPVLGALAHEIQTNIAYDPDDLAGVAAVIRSGTGELYSDLPNELAAASGPGATVLGELLHRLDLASALIVPLRARGRVLGALQLLTARPGRRFDEEDLQLAEDVAGRIATALDNVRLYELQSEVARTLQHSLLPRELPSIPDLDVEVRYWASGAGTEVGGDFYDVFSLGGDSWGVVIGDVCGKGIEAASLTGLARYTLRTAARHEPDPAKVLDWTNEAILEQQGDLYCTAAFARLDPAPGGGRTMALALGGHPHPLLIRHAGNHVEDLGRAGNPLGLFEQVDVSTVDLELHEGDMVVFYTDGVTDVSGSGALDTQSLHDLFFDCPRTSAGECADHLGAAMVRLKPLSERDDDIAIVVLRYGQAQRPQESDGDRGASGIRSLDPDQSTMPDSHREFEYDLSLDPTPSAATARRRFVTWLEDGDVDEAVIEDLSVVLSELLSNGLEASGDGEVRVRATLNEDQVALVVSNPVGTGDADHPFGPSLPDDSDAVSGRGLHVVEALSDSLEIEVVGDNVSVHCMRRR